MTMIWESLRNKRIFIAILFLSLLIRGLYLIEIEKKDPDFYQMPSYTDMATYDHLACSALSGNGFKVFEYSPLYIGFLVAVYWLFGHSVLIVKIIQLLFIGIFSLVLICKIARLLFNEQTAIIAFLLGALYYPYIIYGGVLLSENLLIFFSLLMLYYLLKANVELNLKYIILSGLSLGAAAVTRPSVLTFIPFIFITFLINHKRGQVIKPFLIFCFVVVITIFPAILSNYLASGKLVLVRANGGITFYLGNNPHTDGSGYITDHTPHLSKLAEEIKHTSFDERDKFYYHQAITFIKNTPGKFSRLLWNKFIMFWSAREINNNIAPAVYRRFSRSVHVAFISFGILLPFALLGIALNFKRLKQQFLLSGFIVSQMATTIAFHVVDRFRQHIVGILIIFAGFFFAEAIKLFKLHKIGLLRTYLGIVFIILLALNFTQIRKNVYPLFHPHGTYTEELNRLIISDCRLTERETDYWTFFSKSNDKILKILELPRDPTAFAQAGLFLDAIILPETTLNININGAILPFISDKQQIINGRIKINLPVSMLQKGKNSIIISARPEKHFYILIDNYLDYNRSAFFSQGKWDFDNLGSWSYLGDGEYRIFIELKNENHPQ
ncbi:MAG: glycosyltransferase family 39 protein [Candidatus Omnitrophota bacterium]